MGTGPGRGFHFNEFDQKIDTSKVSFRFGFVFVFFKWPIDSSFHLALTQSNGDWSALDQSEKGARQQHQQQQQQQQKHRFSFT